MRNFNGTLINQSVTVVETAGADIADVRNRILAYDEDGNVVLAEDGSVMPLGIALIETGLNDMSGNEAGKIKSGDDVDIQIKDIGYAISGGTIAKGAEITASKGKAVTASAGDYVIGIALGVASEGDYVRIQIGKYQKNATAQS